MASISIAGKVTMPPEIKYFDSGTSVAKFSVIDRAYVRPEKGQDEAAGQFYEVEVWGKYVDIVADRCLKGSRVAVYGTAVWREYETKDGRKGKAFQIKNPDITFLDTKAEKEALAGGGGGSASPSSAELPF